MEKVQVKPKKDKKKNNETGILMGQNINVFSQLSATYLTGKSNVTQEEEHFVKQTQIIEYHDQNINRIISLLRKKADVTKAKAVQQLKEAVQEMNENQIEQFIATYASLYQEIVVNEQSKQVFEEFIEITTVIFEKFKKIALKQIGTLFPSMLLSMKVSRINKLLFTGSDQEMNEKAFLLLMKKQVRKKLILVSNLLLQTDQIHLISQSNYQRNIYQYVKMIKDILNIYLNHSKRKQLQEDTQKLVRDICELLVGKTTDEYFKAGGKGKASLIEIYSYFVKFASLQKSQHIPWKKFAKVVCQHFLDKDSVVQNTLWKYCNKQILVSLRQISRNEERPDEYALFNQNLPKSEQRLIEVLTLGGLSMYKALPSYLKEHSSFVISGDDGHKSIVQKITYMRKFMGQLVSQEDQHQTRIECYYLIAEYLIETMLYLQNNKLENIIVEKQAEKIEDSKKAKEIRTLIEKLKIQLITNLEKNYYAEPPMSKNSFAYHVPEFFSKLLNNFQIPHFVPTFNDKLTFQLYKGLKADSPLLEIIYSKSEQNLSLLLNFYEIWPQSGKQINLDMTENNEEYEKTAKIFLLANKKRTSSKNIWFMKNWDLRKSAIIYDPRLTDQDLQNQAVQQSHELNLNFSPISKNLQEVYQVPELNENRFEFFLNLLEDNDIETHNLKFFLPYLFTHLITEHNVQSLLEKYLLRANLLKQGKWVVGQKEIAFLRIAVRVFNTHLLKHQQSVTQTLINKFRPYFMSIGNFLKTLNTYKMDKDVLEILKELNQLLRVPEYEEQLLQCVQNILKDIFSILNKSSISSSNEQREQKLRKNRLKRINEFVEESVWYLLRKNSQKYTDIILDLFKQEHLWSEAQAKVQPWAVGFTILSKSGESTIQKISKQMISNFDEHYRMISLLFSCQFMLPLQVYPEYKRVYMHLQAGLSKEFSQLTVELQLFNIQQLMIYQYEQGLLTESLGLKNLLNSTLKYYQTFSPNDITTLSKEIVQVLFNKILTQPQNSHKINVKSVIASHLLAQVPLQDLVNSLETVYQNVLDILEKEVKNMESHFSKFLSLCLLVNNLWRTPIGQTALLKWEQHKVIENLLNRLVPQINEIQPTSTYHSYVIFSTINSLYSTFGYDLVSPNLESIMRVFWQRKEDERANEMYIFKQEQRIRFINRVFLDIKKQNAYQIIQKLPKQALEEYGHYEKFLLELEEQQDEDTGSIQQKSIHGLFIEYSELLMKMTTFFNLGQKQNIPDETVLIQLLQCPFAGVKKTSFILLKQLYDFKLVKPAIPQVFKDVLVFKLKNDHDIEDLRAVNEIYNFLYSWLTLITRRKAIEVASENEEEELTLEDYIQSSGLSELFLNNVFALIADKIDYLKYENEFPLSSEELLMDDFTLNIEEDTKIAQKLFTLASKVLFAYAINFPLFLRSFMDKSKKYRSVCEKLLRNYISDAIFSKEVAMIEIREPEWKASGNLEIYVIKKNKQIYAEYQHDVIRIGLRLVMRPNYPLTPIHIEFGEGLKMQDGSKWALMLQSQLHNKNNSIINGVMLWKQNIDKKLSGIEECVICYDIVNPKGHTPKKSCKTCKKRFHSNCIMKWFSKSNKSECPLCKSQFL